MIVANERGARDAVEFESVSDLGFPLSISPTFQERNTRASIDEAWRRLDIVPTCVPSRARISWSTSAWGLAILMGMIGMKKCPQCGQASFQSFSPLL